MIVCVCDISPFVNLCLRPPCAHPPSDDVAAVKLLLVLQRLCEGHDPWRYLLAKAPDAEEQALAVAMCNSVALRRGVWSLLTTCCRGTDNLARQVGRWVPIAAILVPCVCGVRSWKGEATLALTAASPRFPTP